MKQFGIVSYNIHCNFTNYGSALQSWAMQQAVDRLGKSRWQSVLVDYCPDVLRDKNPRDPIRHMWDTDEESREMCRLSMPAIQVNADEFDRFYQTEFRHTRQMYTSGNFNSILQNEALDGFICGSDTIFCIDEFKGFDDGYYAEYPCMKRRSVAYAASFGDSHFTPEAYDILDQRLQNFKAIGLRESAMLPYVSAHMSGPVQRVLDPTLLLTVADYAPITAAKLENRPYLLLYARRYNPEMSVYAEQLAKDNGWVIIEISLRAVNAKKHRMFYEAGVEEFLSLVKHAACVVTNSYHGIIFSIQFQRDFYAFSREQCDTKITELLELLGLADRLIRPGKKPNGRIASYQLTNQTLQENRAQSLSFLENELNLLLEKPLQEAMS